MVTAWIFYLGFLMMAPKAAFPTAFEDDPSATPERIEYSWQIGNSGSLPHCNRHLRGFPVYLAFSCLFDLDPGLLDHLAPPLFLAAHITIEFFRRPRHHDEAFIDAKPPESVGLYG